MKVFWFIVSICTSIAVAMTVTDLQSQVHSLLLGEEEPQHRTVSLKPQEDPSLLDKGLDTLAAMFGVSREEPKSDLQQLMDRRRKEIAREQSGGYWP